VTPENIIVHNFDGNESDLLALRQITWGMVENAEIKRLNFLVKTRHRLYEFEIDGINIDESELILNQI